MERVNWGLRLGGGWVRTMPLGATLAPFSIKRSASLLWPWYVA